MSASDDRPPPAADAEATVGAGAVVVRDAAVLLVRTTYGWATGKWLIPNGAQHPGESLSECAVRELREESGLRGAAGRVVALRSLASARGSDTFVAVEVEARDGEPQPDGRETDAARFFTLAEIEELVTAGSIVRLHRIIAQHVLGDETLPPVQELPAVDRDGNPARATVYLF